MKKIHVGQLWLNRSGEEVRIVKEHNNKRMLKFTGHVNDRETEGYCADGRVHVDGTDSAGDLVTLIEESPAVFMIHRLREALTRVMSHVNDPELIALVDALRELFRLVVVEVNSGGVSAMMLEQGGFGIRSNVAHPGFMDVCGTYFINFYDARDLGYREGLIVDGKVIN